MIFHPVYIVWALLPFALFCLSIWALVKPYFGVSGSEDSWDYFKQTFFCCLAFFIAIGIDQLPLDDYLGVLSEDPTSMVYVVHWILFPLVLVGMAYLYKVLKKALGKEKPDELSLGLARYKR